MKRPPSSGQHLRIGSCSRLARSPSSTTSWHGASRTTLGPISESSFSRGSILSLSRTDIEPPPALRGSSSVDSISATRSSIRSTPSAMVRRVIEPKVLVRTGVLNPRTRSKRSAGPPARVARCVISVISSSESTSLRTRSSSPAAVRSAMNSRRSRYGRRGIAALRSGRVVAEEVEVVWMVAIECPGERVRGRSRVRRGILARGQGDGQTPAMAPYSPDSAMR